jgi:hypothetical protein
MDVGNTIHCLPMDGAEALLGFAGMAFLNADCWVCTVALLLQQAASLRGVLGGSGGLVHRFAGSAHGLCAYMTPLHAGA